MSLSNFSSTVRRVRNLTTAAMAVAAVCSSFAVSALTITEPQTFERTYTFRELGVQYPLQLRGIQGVGGVSFSVRSDEVVSSAQVRLSYSYSPALLSNISHIKVMVNGQVAATLPVPRETAGAVVERTVAIDSRLLSDFNRLDFELIGHYTMECEDPQHSSLWATIDGKSSIDLRVESIAQANELSLLPRPFFDPRDSQMLKLPFVFPAAPTPQVLEAAGSLSSWFGGLAGYRGASFTASVGVLPAKGNAVVMLLDGAGTVAGVPTPAITGPTITVVEHPRDRFSKLLLVRGRTPQELKTAAAAIVLGSSTLSGAQAVITDMKPLQPRQPYDAPHWLPSDRPVRLGELAPLKDLSVSGYSPDLIRVNMHMPPGLFNWRDKGVPIDLHYRYTPRPQSSRSTLNFSVNDQFVQAMPLLSAKTAAPNAMEQAVEVITPDSPLQPARVKMRVPLYKLSAASQLRFHYFHEITKSGACRDVPLDNLRGTVEPESTMDISGFARFAPMPDLAAFGNSGFPFTRMADLSESAVVLPEQPTPTDWGAYLDLMGLMGNATGYPTLGVQVATAQDTAALSNKDLLVLAPDQRQPLLTTWASHLPITLSGQVRQFKLSELASRITAWWGDRSRDAQAAPQTQLDLQSSGADAVMVGFESPVTAGRSVVMLAGDGPLGLAAAVQAMRSPETLKQVQGSAVVVRGDQVNSLLAEKTYHVGSLSPFVQVQWYLSSRPLLLVAVGLLAALLVGGLLYLVLKTGARERLQNKPS